MKENCCVVAGCHRCNMLYKQKCVINENYFISFHYMWWLIATAAVAAAAAAFTKFFAYMNPFITILVR